MNPKYPERKVVQEEPTLFQSEADWEKEWQGMPEFSQSKQVEHGKIIVRFSNEQDLQDFARAIGQKLTSKTKSIWYPANIRGEHRGKKYVSKQ